MICNIFRVTFKDTFRVNTFKEFLFSLVFVDHKDSSHGHVLALKLGDLRWYLDSVISGTMMPHLQALFQLDKAYRLSLVVSFHRVIYISEGEKVLALNACLCVYFMASSSNFLQRKTWWW